MYPSCSGHSFLINFRRCYEQTTALQKSLILEVNGDGVQMYKIILFLLPCLLISVTSISALADNYIKPHNKSKSQAIGGFSNAIGMQFEKIPAGTFYMGNSDTTCFQGSSRAKDELDRCLQASGNGVESDEFPYHMVFISTDFFMAKHEVTQAQWQAVMGNNPSVYQSNILGEDTRNFPVEKVSWNDIQEFIVRLSAMDGRQYRLPTEAEWEYACHGGAKHQEYCGSNSADEVAWHFFNSQKRTHRVGSKKPNGYGLYDMSGNVWEFVSDWHSNNYYSDGPIIDPSGPVSGRNRVVRGGSWDLNPKYARAASRDGAYVDSTSPEHGFRLVVSHEGDNPRVVKELYKLLVSSIKSFVASKTNFTKEIGDYEISARLDKGSNEVIFDITHKKTKLIDAVTETINYTMLYFRIEPYQLNTKNLKKIIANVNSAFNTLDICYNLELSGKDVDSASCIARPHVRGASVFDNREANTVSAGVHLKDSLLEKLKLKHAHLSRQAVIAKKTNNRVDMPSIRLY